MRLEYQQEVARRRMAELNASTAAAPSTPAAGSTTPVPRDNRRLTMIRKDRQPYAYRGFIGNGSGTPAPESRFFERTMRRSSVPIPGGFRQISEVDQLALELEAQAIGPQLEADIEKQIEAVLNPKDGIFRARMKEEEKYKTPLPFRLGDKNHAEAKHFHMAETSILQKVESLSLLFYLHQQRDAQDKPYFCTEDECEAALRLV